MKIKFYWTRWSTPISSKDILKYWWNTTCLRVYSDCIEEWTVLAIDSWTWFIPLSTDALKEWNVKKVIILYTHYHHDHTQWIFLSPFLFMKHIDFKLVWPIDSWIWPKEMMEHLMKPPFFPVHLKQVESHISYETFQFPPTSVLIFHKNWWYFSITRDFYEKVINWKQYFEMNWFHIDINECLVITMLKSHHPEQTVSFRISEETTWKKFVFLTDHENEEWVSSSFRAHLSWIDFLAIDSQYTREKYMNHTAWFWHWTPDYCARVAKELNIPLLWLIHHDPWSADSDVDMIVETAKNILWDDSNVKVFWIADYDEYEI